MQSFEHSITQNEELADFKVDEKYNIFLTFCLMNMFHLFEMRPIEFLEVGYLFRVGLSIRNSHFGHLNRGKFTQVTSEVIENGICNDQHGYRKNRPNYKVPRYITQNVLNSKGAVDHS